MAKITRKQEDQYVRLLALHHEMIKAKHSNKREEYEAVIEKIKAEVNRNDQK